jgi:hypothetical protein
MVMGRECLGNIELPEYHALNAGRIQWSPSRHSRRQDRGCARSTHVEGETLRRGGTIMDRMVDTQQADHARQDHSTMLLAASFSFSFADADADGDRHTRQARPVTTERRDGEAGTTTSRRKRGVQRKESNSPGHQRDRPCTCALAEGQGRFGPWRSWSDQRLSSGVVVLGGCGDWRSMRSERPPRRGSRLAPKAVGCVSGSDEDHTAGPFGGSPRQVSTADRDR